MKSSRAGSPPATSATPRLGSAHAVGGPSRRNVPGMSQPHRRPRVGHIEYLNCVPIYWGLMRSGALLDVELTRASPVALNDALVAGELDIAPISLVEYLRHADDLLLLPGVAVGSDGRC